MLDFQHITVLKDTLVDKLGLTEGGIAVDCTLGGGGHTERLLRKVGATGKVIAIDRDYDAIKLAETKFSQEISNQNLILEHQSFADFDKIISRLSLMGKVHAVAADLGVSSPQIDTPERGFSFMHDSPLDMRMDQRQQKTAADVVNLESEEHLVHIFSNYGEEPFSKSIARKIVASRSQKPIQTTFELSHIIIGAQKFKERSKKHPATRVFQALRIEVNEEISALERLLYLGFESLRPQGRMGLISFHSLEDRVIKNFMRKKAGIVPISNELRHLPVVFSQKNSLAKIIKPFPLEPLDEETTENPRARSAKLRVLEKLTLH